MDYCVDCDQLLRNAYCGSCKMIYGYKYNSNDICRFCNRQSIKSVDQISTIRYVCEYCNYHYFYSKDYVDDNSDIDEFKQSLEIDCEECDDKAMISRITGELVCLSCGLIHDRILMKS